MLRFFFIILLILLSITSNADVVYKCFSADGKVTLSDETCPSGMRSETLNIAPNVNQMKVMPDAPKPLKLPEKSPNKSTTSPIMILPVAPIKLFPKQPPDDGLGDGYGVLSREYRATKKGKPYWGDGLGDGNGVFSKEHRRHQQNLEKQEKYRDKHP